MTFSRYTLAQARGGLALQESTEIHVVALRGKEHERILIRDRPLYEWAMKQVHQLAQPGREAA